MPRMTKKPKNVHDLTRKFGDKTYRFFSGYDKLSAKKKSAELRKMGYNCRVIKHKSDDWKGVRYDVYTNRKKK